MQKSVLILNELNSTNLIMGPIMLCKRCQIQEQVEIHAKYFCLGLIKKRKLHRFAKFLKRELSQITLIVRSRGDQNYTFSKRGIWVLFQMLNLILLDLY